jgi:hypothetical protein
MKNERDSIMNGFRVVTTLAVALFSTNAMAVEYSMTCDEVITKLNLEATAAAKERFADLKGSCLGVVDRDGDLYMHTQVVVRRSSAQRVTLYLPATDRTFDVTPDSGQRIPIAGRNVRVASLARGQELNIYISIDQFMQPIIEEVAFEPVEEVDIIVVVPAVIAPALPTTG